MFSGCLSESHIITVPYWLSVTLTVLQRDIALLAFEKFLVLFSGHKKNCIFTTAQISVYNGTIFLQLHNLCAQLHTKKPPAHPSVIHIHFAINTVMPYMFTS